EIQKYFQYFLFGGNEMSRAGNDPGPVHVSSATGYLHDSLTIFTSVIFMWPCSASLFFMPLSFAASFASSFMLCIVAFDTTPVAVTVELVAAHGESWVSTPRTPWMTPRFS